MLSTSANTVAIQLSLLDTSAGIGCCPRFDKIWGVVLAIADVVYGLSSQEGLVSIIRYEVWLRTLNRMVLVAQLISCYGADTCLRSAQDQKHLTYLEAS